jgi:hypothetical protein
LLEGADPILDDELLSEPLGQPLSHQARGKIAAAAGRKADDKTHRPRRIGLRSCHPQDCRQRGSARCQMQKSTAGKFHGVAPGDTKAIPIPVPLKGATISGYGTNAKFDGP